MPKSGALAHSVESNKMIRQLKQFFEQSLVPQDAASDDAHALKLAAASLLFEMMRMDDQIQTAEREAVADAVRQTFDLPEDEIKIVLQLAEQEAKQATDYFQFTSLINAHYNAAQKVQLIEQLWRVAFADQHLDLHEEHMVRKISELLYVPHKDFIAAKLRVQGP